MISMDGHSFEDEIRRNERATVLVVVFMFLLLFGIVFAIGYILGATPWVTGILALIVSAGYIGIMWSHSTSTVIAASDARPAFEGRREEKLLMDRVEEIAIAAGLPVPKVYIQDSRDINAFAAGLTPQTAIICVTTGAIEQLSQEELEGVIAHEMSHVLNKDMRLATLTIAIVGAIAMIAEIGMRLAWFGGMRGGRGRDRQVNPIVIVIAIVGVVLAPILARLTYLFLSRRREYLADASGARLSRNPEGLAGALKKILGDEPDDPKGSKTVAGLYLANPWTRHTGGSIWSTHPPLEERIRRLEQM